MNFAKDDLIDYFRDAIDVSDEEAYYPAYILDFSDILFQLENNDILDAKANRIIDGYQDDIKLYLKYRD